MMILIKKDTPLSEKIRISGEILNRTEEDILESAVNDYLGVLMDEEKQIKIVKAIVDIDGVALPCYYIKDLTIYGRKYRRIVLNGKVINVPSVSVAFV